MTAFRSLLFLIIAPGLLAAYIPLAFLREGTQIETGIFAYLALPLWLMGALVLMQSFWDFLVRGRGTPAPIDPPKELVVAGFYRYVRNPMYVAVLLILFGYFLWFGYWSFMIYAGLAFIATHLFVALYEDPNLRRRFGESYEVYLRKVPRWIPRIPTDV